MKRLGSHSSDGMQSSVPAIVPTLDGRISGLFWPGAARGRTSGLIVLSDADVDMVALGQVLALLRAHCQMDGISILEIGQRPSGAAYSPVDSNRYALDVLAGITHLRSLGISEVAVIYCGGGSWTAPSEETQSQLFAGCVEAMAAICTNRRDLMEQLAGLADSIRSAADCLRGLMTAKIVRDGFQRQADALYNWASGALYRHSTDTYTAPAASLRANTAGQSKIVGNWQVTRDKTSNLRAETVRARNIARRNLTFLQHQWDAVIEDLEERDGIRAARVRHEIARMAIGANKRLATPGNPQERAMVLQAARSCWRFLDWPARQRWLEAWTQVFPLGGLLEEDRQKEIPASSITLH